MLIFVRMISYRQAATTIGWVLFFHALGMLALYSWYPYFDVPMHFGGGVAMGVLALALWDHHIRSITFSVKNPWVKHIFFALCILGFVGLVGIAWEWFEFGLDEFFTVRNNWGLAQAGLSDTMADLFLDLLGGLVVVLWYKV